MSPELRFVDNMSGDSVRDARLARDVLRNRYGFTSDKAVDRWLKSEKVTLHHRFNGAQMELVPTLLHNNGTGIPHGGGAANLRIWDHSSGTPIQRLYANRIAAAGRGLGYAGMAYGAYEDGGRILMELRESNQTGHYGNTAGEVARVAGGWSGAAVLGSAGAEFGGAIGWVGGPIGSAAGAVIFGALGGALGYWGVSGAITDITSMSGAK